MAEKQKTKSKAVLDPVAAYELLAPAFARVSEGRRAYLDAVERLVVETMPAPAESLLDIGAGDASRSLRIARAAGIGQTVLLEPSAAMRQAWPAGLTAWEIRAEQLATRQGRFDAITCLWNTLGHIFPGGARAETLRQCARLLAPEGRVFLDVCHRYNASHYGAWKTAARFVRDRFAACGATGDVEVQWNTGGGVCRTLGHVFTAPELLALFRGAGLRVERRYVVDYANGAVRKWAWQGHLLYALRR
ncbi:MAG TPA: methyltransferase domain-containing protein [Bryobacteraceae bacterium]|nr:methyltransferase domain-containing protein [Bryobacteraceae bacterium]